MGGIHAEEYEGGGLGESEDMGGSPQILISRDIGGGSDEDMVLIRPFLP